MSEMLPSEDTVRVTYETLAEEIPELGQKLPLNRVLLRLNSLGREVLRKEIEKVRGGASELKRLLSTGDPRDEAKAIYCIIATAAETSGKEKQMQQDTNAEEETLEALLSQIDPLEEESSEEKIPSIAKDTSAKVESFSERSLTEDDSTNKDSLAEESLPADTMKIESQPADSMPIEAQENEHARYRRIIQALKSTVVRLCRERDKLRKLATERPGYISEAMIDTMLRAISGLGEVFTPAEVHTTYIKSKGKQVKKGTVTRAIRELSMQGYIEHVRLGGKVVRGYYRLTRKGRKRLARQSRGK